MSEFRKEPQESMVRRIGEFVVSGELRNTRRNGVFGWLEFAPDFAVRIELTGNLNSSLLGKHVRFTVDRDQTKKALVDLPEEVNELADRQIGVVGEMTIRKVKVPALPIDQFLDLTKEQRDQHVVEKNSLYLEWYSQNGKIVAEIIDPSIEFVDNDEDASTTEGYGLGLTEIHIDEDGVVFAQSQEELDDTDEDEPEDDPYGLFGSDFQQKVEQSLDDDESEQPLGESLVDSPLSETGEGANGLWEELSADIDPETKSQWDEIFGGQKDEPITYLFPSPLKLPKPDNVQSDEEAEPYVRQILAQLALLSVALDVCEHFSPRDTYRLLMTEILPSAKVHPNLAASEMVQHYSTSDFCSTCEKDINTDDL